MKDRPRNLLLLLVSTCCDDRLFSKKQDEKDVQIKYAARGKGFALFTPLSCSHVSSANTYTDARDDISTLIDLSPFARCVVLFATPFVHFLP